MVCLSDEWEMGAQSGGDGGGKGGSCSFLKRRKGGRGGRGPHGRGRRALFVGAAAADGGLDEERRRGAGLRGPRRSLSAEQSSSRCAPVPGFPNTLGASGRSKSGRPLARPHTRHIFV